MFNGHCIEVGPMLDPNEMLPLLKSFAIFSSMSNKKKFTFPSTTIHNCVCHNVHPFEDRLYSLVDHKKRSQQKPYSLPILKQIHIYSIGFQSDCIVCACQRKNGQREDQHKNAIAHECPRRLFHP